MAKVRTGIAVPEADILPGGHPAASGLRIFALATGFVMATLDVTVVNVAGATIQTRLHASLTELTWIIDGYILVFASLLILAGGVANRVGARTIYMRGMVVFLISSAICAMAPDAGILIAARLVQGAGAALFMPSSLALLVFSFPEKRERTRVLGLWSAIVATSSGLGPTVGGILVSLFGWRSIFLINIPIGLTGIVMTRRYIAGVEGRPGKLAIPGHVAGILALGGLSFALIEGPQIGWLAVPVLIAYAVTISFAAVLAVGQRRTASPILPWELFRRHGFAGANLVGFLFNFGLFGSLFMLSLYFQHARGASPFRAGIELLPMTILFPIGNIVYSRISARIGNGTLLTLFLAVAGVASLTMVGVTSATPYWLLAIAVGVANSGAGIISPAMTAALVNSAGPENANVAGASLNANRQIGSLVGIAAISVVLRSVPGWDGGADMSFLLVGLVYAAGALAAWLLIVRAERAEIMALQAEA
jgi:DHA2 family methylenomycin A resistance protein-like MFS transporter